MTNFCFSCCLFLDAESGSEPSSIFTVNPETGYIYSLTNSPAMGIHQITVNIFNMSDPTLFPDTAYVSEMCFDLNILLHSFIINFLLPRTQLALEIFGFISTPVSV